MFPVGSNAINDRTIGESAQGLAEYVMDANLAGGEPSCAIAYDTRHRSEHFAKLCSEILLAAGFKIFSYEDIAVLQSFRMRFATPRAHAALWLLRAITP